MRRPWPEIAASLWLGLMSGCFPEPPPETPGGDDAAANAAMWAPKKLSELYARGDVRAFEFRQEGELIGRSWGRYAGPEKIGERELHRLETKIELLPKGAEPLRSSSWVLVDDEGHLAAGSEHSVAARLSFEVADEVLTIEAHTGMPVRQREELAYRKGTAFMGYMATMHEEIMFATRELKPGPLDLRMISLSAGRADEWSGLVRRDGNSIAIDTSLGETVFFANGRISRIEVADDRLEVRSLSDAPWPDWEVDAPRVLRYEKPADATFTIEQVELPGREGEPKLVGEVLRPPGEGPFPAVLVLTGGSPADRWGFAGPPAVDLGTHAIGDALAEAGFLVLRYDERGVGSSARAEISWSGQREDARRAFRTLMVQEGIDADRVVLVGHGEGGWRAMGLAAERKREVVGVALLATDGRGFRKRFEDQPALIKAMESGTGLPAGLEELATWYREVLDVDPAKLVSKVPCPIWIAQGAKDFEVDANTAVAALEKAARKSKRKYEVARFEELDHLFKHEPGKSTHESYLADRPVDRGFLEALTTWAKARATK